MNSEIHHATTVQLGAHLTEQSLQEKEWKTRYLGSTVTFQATLSGSEGQQTLTYTD